MSIELAGIWIYQLRRLRHATIAANTFPTACHDPGQHCLPVHWQPDYWVVLLYHGAFVSHKEKTIVVYHKVTVFFACGIREFSKSLTKIVGWFGRLLYCNVANPPQMFWQTGRGRASTCWLSQTLPVGRYWVVPPDSCKPEPYHNFREIWKILENHKQKKPLLCGIPQRSCPCGKRNARV